MFKVLRNLVYRVKQLHIRPRELSLTDINGERGSLIIVEHRAPSNGSKQNRLFIAKCSLTIISSMGTRDAVYRTRPVLPSTQFCDVFRAFAHPLTILRHEWFRSLVRFANTPIGDVNASANWNTRKWRKKECRGTRAAKIRNYRNGRGSIIAPRAFVIQRVSLISRNCRRSGKKIQLFRLRVIVAKI